MTHINDDSIEIDYIKFDPESGPIEMNLIKRGCQIFLLTSLRKNLFKYCFEVFSTIKKGNYDVIHCNGGFKSFIALFFAKILGVKIRIAHAHFYKPSDSQYRNFIKKISVALTSCFATHLLGCGEKVSEWTWGENNKASVLYNAIDFDNFTFNSSLRTRLRNDYNLNNLFTIGCIARLSDEKNQIFLIQLMEKFKNLSLPIKLVLVGDGPDLEFLKGEVNSRQLHDYVVFLGQKNNINELMNAFDLVALPSKFEGFPVVSIEAQVNGVSLLISSNVSDEVLINSNARSLPLDLDLWFKHILNMINKHSYDHVLENRLIESYSKYFDIRISSQQLLNIYRSGSSYNEAFYN